jgi:regulator of RNase E activity RraB
MRSSDLILLVIPLPDKYIVPYPQELIDLIEYFDTATDEFDKVFPDPNSQDDPGFKEEVV